MYRQRNILQSQSFLVDHSSKLHDPIALSYTNAKYNQASLTTMATTRISRLFADLELQPPSDSTSPTILILDGKSKLSSMTLNAHIISFAITFIPMMPLLPNPSYLTGLLRYSNLPTLAPKAFLALAIISF